MDDINKEVEVKTSNISKLPCHSPNKPPPIKSTVAIQPIQLPSTVKAVASKSTGGKMESFFGKVNVSVIW